MRSIQRALPAKGNRNFSAHRMARISYNDQAEAGYKAVRGVSRDGLGAWALRAGGTSKSSVLMWPGLMVTGETPRTAGRASSLSRLCQVGTACPPTRWASARLGLGDRTSAT